MNAPDPATTYGAHANPDLLSRIPLDARAVLDIGCGAGALGAAFRKRNPATRLIGIEPDPELRAHAATHLDEVHGTSIEEEAPPVPPGSLDAMIFGDVLEHLRDPWAVLKRDIGLLSERGVLLICVPNIEHWSFAARLLAGEWRYERMGLFDRTHLRWFTRETMKEALEGAGYVPLEVAPRVFGRERAEGFAKAIAPGLSALGVEMNEWARRALPLQYVWRAARVRPKPLLLVGRTDPADEAGARRRVLEPFAALATQPGVGTVAGPSARVPAGIGDTPRVVVLQGGVKLDEALRVSGAVIVRDCAGELRAELLDGVQAVQVADEAQAAAARAMGLEVAVFAGGAVPSEVAARLGWYRGLCEKFGRGFPPP